MLPKYFDIFFIFWKTFYFVLFTLEQFLSEGVKLQISERVQIAKSVQNFSRPTGRHLPHTAVLSCDMVP